MSLYPALTQSNLGFELQEYKEEETIHVNNFKNYVKSAQARKIIVDEDDNIHHGVTYWSQVSFDEFVLPGQGQAKPYCKKWISWGCNNTKQHPYKQHYAEHELKTCKIAFCPKCYESWINRQANRSTRRFIKFLENKQYYFRHIVLSPPQEQAKAMSYIELKKWFASALKVANIKTAAVIFHPFRFQDREKVQPYVSPHFHLLVYGKVTNTTEFYNKTNWLIKNKGDMKTEVDIFNCVRYLLSHAGVKKKTHAVRYLGDISYRKLKVEKEPQNHNCPHCDRPLMIFHIVKSNKSDPPPIDHVGLWEPSCFEPIDYYDPEIKIPFYEMNDDGISYDEHLIYSFEEILAVQTNAKIISDIKYEMSQLDFKTSIHCQKLEQYQINHNSEMSSESPLGLDERDMRDDNSEIESSLHD